MSELNSSQFRRLASYINFPNIENIVSVTKLASSGYFYTGHDTVIKCEGCSVKVEIFENFTHEQNVLRHQRGCAFEINSQEEADERITDESLSLQAINTWNNTDLTDLFPSEYLELNSSKDPSKLSKKCGKLFIIHHPHGDQKVLSYGDFVAAKYKYSVDVSTAETSNGQKKSSTICLDTCPQTVSQENSKSIVQVQSEPMVEPQVNVATDVLAYDDFTDLTDLFPSEYLELNSSKDPSKLSKKCGKLFIIHHPHGDQKVLSYGDFVAAKYKYSVDVSTAETSNGQKKSSTICLDTCPQTVSQENSKSIVQVQSEPMVEPQVNVATDVLAYDDFTDSGSESDNFESMSGNELGVVLRKVSRKVRRQQKPIDQITPLPRASRNLHVQDPSDFSATDLLASWARSNSNLSSEDAKEESRRAASFQASGCPQHLQRIGETLADNGFYWTGNKKIIQCYECNLKLYVENQDDAVTTHREMQPPCPLISSTPHNPRPLISSTPHNPRPLISSTPHNPRPLISSTPHNPRPLILSTPDNQRPLISSTSQTFHNPRPLISSTPHNPRPLISSTPDNQRPLTSSTPDNQRPLISSTPHNLRPMTSSTTHSAQTQKARFGGFFRSLRSRKK